MITLDYAVLKDYFSKDFAMDLVFASLKSNLG